jgi:hypothetical protein
VAFALLKRVRPVADPFLVQPRTKALITLTAALAAPVPVALALHGGGADAVAAGNTLADVAAHAGCQLHEFDHTRTTNPPVTGKVDERITAKDGSYVGRPSPSTLASTHALLHGRVVFQYAPTLPERQVEALDRLVRRDSDRVLLFANRTGMPEPVAATAYLTLMTCPRVDRATLGALRAFRDRRRGFGTAF